MNGESDPPNSVASNPSELPDENSVMELLGLLSDLNLLSESINQKSGIPNRKLTSDSKSWDKKEGRASASSNSKIGAGSQQQGIESEGKSSEEQKKNPTPTFSNHPSLPQRIANLETQLNHLERQVYQPTELIDPLLPLLRELLSIKTGESREAILKAVVPAVDEILKQRGQQEPQKMSQAIAGLLPGAISQEIQEVPTAIGKAIAPEIALALQEQSRLDRHALSQALGPEMGKAIKVQIVEERDAMIDALYPVIGNTISKYMVEMVAEINEKVEKALSFQGIQRRVKARFRGVSEAELILQESLDFTLQALFLIHKESGLIIWEAQPSQSFRLESDLVAGMLTAIREFAGDCVTPQDKVSELHEIDFDGTAILLEVAGFCYLAAVITGKTSPAFLQNLRQVFGEVVLHYGEEIAEFVGDPESFPQAARFRLEKLLEPEAKEKSRKPPYAILLLLLFLLLPLGFLTYRSQVAARTEKRVASALHASPELSVYNLIPEIDSGKLTLTGRVPDASLRAKAAEIASSVAPEFALDNQILPVDLPPTANQAKQIVNLFNLLDLRAYFSFNSSQLQVADRKELLPFLLQFLATNPQVYLRLIGYSDSVGTDESKQKLAIARARNLQQELIGRGINPARLQIASRLSLPPRRSPDSPDWSSRCVLFEAFLPNASEE